jgi:hypothetical protein
LQFSTMRMSGSMGGSGTAKWGGSRLRTSVELFAAQDHRAHACDVAVRSLESRKCMQLQPLFAASWLDRCGAVVLGKHLDVHLAMHHFLEVFSNENVSCA